MLCKYINYSWFPSRKPTQVLRFVQSHDHTVYSKRGPLWDDLVWKSALLHKCEILEDLHQRLVPEEGDRRENICDHMEQCGIPPFPVQSQTGLTPIREWCPFSLPLTLLSSTSLRSFSQPGDGRFLTKCPSWMQWMLHAKTSQLNSARGG